MIKRILTALVGVPLLIGAVWGGFPWLPIVVALAALLGLWELYRMSPAPQPSLLLEGHSIVTPHSPSVTPSSLTVTPNGVRGLKSLLQVKADSLVKSFRFFVASLLRMTIKRPWLFLGGLWTILFIVTGQLAGQWYDYAPHVLLGAGLLIALPWLILNRNRDGALAAWTYAVGGPVYLGFLLAHALMLRELEGGADNFGRDWLLFALVVTFATDTGAFFTGRMVGRHPMAPSISPNKTWEGAVGGFVWAVGIAVGLGVPLQLSVPLWQAALMGAVIGVFAQLGDLAESRLKRATGVKDAGSILPGHGGFLDRLDSIVFTLPVVYYLVALVLKSSG